MEQLVSAVGGNGSFVSRHKFLILVVVVIAISLVLTVISVDIYTTSGAADLDLSRPGYQSISNQAVSNDDSLVDYPSSGPVNPSTISQFESEYTTQVKNSSAIDAFGGDPLNTDALQISDPANS